MGALRLIGSKWLSGSVAEMPDLKLNDVNIVLVEHHSKVRNGLRMLWNEASLDNNIGDKADF